MKKILSLVMLAVLVACGSSSKETSEPLEAPEETEEPSTPAEETPPWELNPAAEYRYYTEVLLCPEATATVEEVLSSWTLSADTREDPVLTPGGTPLYSRLWIGGPPGSSMISLVNGNTGNIIMVVLEIADEEANTSLYTLMNYSSVKLMKDVFDGTIDLEIDEDDVFAVAKDVYFCLYSPVLDSTIYNPN